eukprot:Sdes_comp20045_c0_seq1m12899
MQQEKSEKKNLVKQSFQKTMISQKYQKQEPHFVAIFILCIMPMVFTHPLARQINSHHQLSFHQAESEFLVSILQVETPDQCDCNHSSPTHLWSSAVEFNQIYSPASVEGMEESEFQIQQNDEKTQIKLHLCYQGACGEGFIAQKTSAQYQEIFSSLPEVNSIHVRSPALESEKKTCFAFKGNCWKIEATPQFRSP